MQKILNTSLQEKKTINVLLSSVILGKLKDSHALAQLKLTDNNVSQLFVLITALLDSRFYYGFLASLERWHVLLSLSKEDLLMNYSVLNPATQVAS